MRRMRRVSCGFVVRRKKKKKTAFSASHEQILKVSEQSDFSRNGALERARIQTPKWGDFSRANKKRKKVNSQARDFAAFTIET
jgi:hypothetical protein